MLGNIRAAYSKCCMGDMAGGEGGEGGVWGVGGGVS